MQPLYVILNQIKIGFSGTIDETSRYNYIGHVLQRRGDVLRDTAVVAFYSAPSSKDYVHAAIETAEGALIAERFAPQDFRDHEGWVTQDMVRTTLFVSAIIGWLESSQLIND